MDNTTRFRVASLMNRGKLFRWLWGNHDAIESWFSTEPPRRWKTLLTAAQGDGVTDIKTTGAVRHAWSDVQREWQEAPDAVRRALSPTEPGPWMTKSPQQTPIAADRPRTRVFFDPSDDPGDPPLTDVEGRPL